MSSNCSALQTPWNLYKTCICEKMREKSSACLSIVCKWQPRRQVLQRINPTRVSFWCFRCNDETLTCETCWCKIYPWFISLRVLSFCQPIPFLMHSETSPFWNTVKTFGGIAESATRNRFFTSFSSPPFLTARHYTSVHSVLYEKVCYCIQWDAFILTSVPRKL